MGPGQAQGQEGEEGEREFESRAGFAKYRVNQNQQIILKKLPHKWLLLKSPLLMNPLISHQHGSLKYT